MADSQNPQDVPPAPEAALEKITVPEGFQVTLFAGEPQVRQPIAMELDDLGRLWVAECYAYRTWRAEGQDRLLIFEDTDNDGRFDTRRVFWNEGNYLTGFTRGFGGVWVCCAPHLLFIPDKNHDDVPDGPPEKILDGWSTQGVHNVLNTLKWGPDGWLYGCNGITAPSLVGKPDAKKEDRIEMSCGIWRYHPTRGKFEVVAHGTTNPWGLDWDRHGQAFFTNCVIDHLWHLIPGGRYQRMFGQDLNPHAYKLLGATSDHLHWQGKEWQKARGGEDHDSLGGGHAHAGCLIYQGNNWPEKYRGTLFTCNLHGNRINNDTLARRGSGYVGKHAPDFLKGNDPWFRGVVLCTGPDGGVYLSDWCDLGECHDSDGVHRSSGRVYKITHGKPDRPPLHLADLSDSELVMFLQHENRWFTDKTLRLLQERAAAREIEKTAREALHEQLISEEDEVLRLRSLWALHVIGAADEALLLKAAEEKSEHLRYWAVQLLCEKGPVSDEAAGRLKVMAEKDSSPLVRLSLASVLQRLPAEQVWPIATALAAHEEDAKDQNLPLMIWYGVESHVAKDADKAVSFINACKIPLVRQHTARRLADR